MLEQLAGQIAALVALAAGHTPFGPLGAWEVEDMKDGGTWSFRNNGSSIVFGWRPSVDGTQCFMITVGIQHGAITADLDNTYPDFNMERFRGVGIRILNATAGLLLDCCIRRELNDLFGPSYKEALLRAEELEYRRLPYVPETRHVRDIGLNHPNPVVKEAFEKAQRMYQGSALDDQKDPSKNN
jgi:hypothetical protein